MHKALLSTAVSAGKVYKYVRVRWQHFKARRQPPSPHHKMNNFPELTGLRGLAALWVLAFHAWVASTPRIISAFGLDLTPFFSCGWAGVQIFFVLSGFLLGLPYALAYAGEGSRPKAIPYLARRLARVFPAYYLQLILLIAFYLSTGKTHLIPNLDSLWRHGLMLFMPQPVGTQPLVGTWWTLPVELSFYLVLPALSTLLIPGKIRYLIILLGVSMPLWRHFTVLTLSGAPMNEKVTMAVQLPGAIDSFGMGMLCAWVHVEIVVKNRLEALRRLMNHRAIPLLASAGLLVPLLYWQHYNYKQYWTDSYIFYLWTPLLNLSMTGIILYASINQQKGIKLLRARPMVYLGTISYGTYLWHFPVIDFLMEHTPLHATNFYVFPLLLILTICATVPIAALSWELLEKHILKIARHV
ncbi:MAG: acyltransferase [Zoogloea sp.]|nr:acyltransferase [Zoogloea sp.]